MTKPTSSWRVWRKAPGHPGRSFPSRRIVATPVRRKSDWKELFQGIYLKRTLSIWAMWFCAYMVANGTITWLPTLYRQTFNLPLETSILYGFMTSAAGVFAAVICALLIDKVGRKRWYAGALLLAPVPLQFSPGSARPLPSRCLFSQALPTPSCRP